MPSLIVVRMILSAPPVASLSASSRVENGAVTNRIDRMEVKGMVERVRDLDDRRSVRIRLTPQGREILDGIFGLHIANMERILQPLDQHTCEQVAFALRILLESLGDTSLLQ
jgi:DNA-binding MarR family transcriptional regulator